MTDHPSLETLRRARDAHKAGRGREALALAEAAYRMATEMPGAPPQAAASEGLYGYLLGTVGGRMDSGLAFCRRAVDNCFWEPAVYESLARLQLAAGNRREAIAVLDRGLAMAGGARELRELRASLGRRRAPALPFLDRSHPFNRWIGILRSRRAAAPAAQAAPAVGGSRGSRGRILGVPDYHR